MFFVLVVCVFFGWGSPLWVEEKRKGQNPPRGGSQVPVLFEVQRIALKAREKCEADQALVLSPHQGSYISPGISYASSYK